MEDCSGMFDYYLDRTSGDIVSDEDEIDVEDNALVWIPTSPSYEGYNLMVEFTGTVDGERLRELLQVALDGKGAFGRFKQVLEDYPDERERWFRFRNEAHARKAREWLDELSIDYVEKKRVPPAKD